MSYLLTKYDKLKYDKCQVYMEILLILDTYHDSNRITQSYLVETGVNCNHFSQ